MRDDGKPLADLWSKLRADADVLLVAAPSHAGPDAIFLAVHANGSVTGFNGHVDLGTGIRTALAQIVAEELGVPFAAVSMVLGSTGASPDQGATIAPSRASPSRPGRRSRG